ncbi:MAG: CNNM domain-containing protein, partial [Pseudomonadota bacterium]|nr:CNNM domain-containing protein [Pseudomonadota bacterium]
MSILLSTAVLVLIIILLIMISAFFSSAETALTAASEARIRQLAKTKANRQAERVEKLRKNKDELISTILVGNNLVNILASALATSAAISLTGDGGVALATVVMTVIIVLFAEVLPKSYAFSNADRLSLKIALIVQIIVWLLKPVTWSLRMIVVRFLGTKDEDDTSREEELRGLIDLHSEDTDEDGILNPGEQMKLYVDIGNAYDYDADSITMVISSEND